MGGRGKPFGRLVFSLSQNEMVQNEMHRTEMKDAYAGLSAGRTVMLATFPEDWRGLTEGFSAERGFWQTFCIKCWKREIEKPIRIHLTKRLPNGTRYYDARQR